MLALIDSGALFHRRAASLMKVEHNTFVKPGSDNCKVFEDLVFIFELSFLISHLVGYVLLLRDFQTSFSLICALYKVKCKELFLRL